MKPQVWTEITSAHGDVSRLVATAFAGAAAPDLPALRARLRRRLDELLSALSPEVTAEVAVSALVPLVFLVDEEVQGRLAKLDAEAEWPLLQRDLFPDGDGGDAFYEQAAALLRAPDPSPLLVGVYLYCLKVGFEGRLVDDPGAIPQWMARLAARLPAAPPPQIAAGPATFHRARPWWVYAATALGAVVVWQVVLLAIARAM